MRKQRKIIIFEGARHMYAATVPEHCVCISCAKRVQEMWAEHRLLAVGHISTQTSVYRDGELGERGDILVPW